MPGDRFITLPRLFALVFGAALLGFLAMAVAEGVSGSAPPDAAALWVYYAIAIAIARVLLLERGLEWRRFVGGYPSGATRVSVLAGVGAAALTYGCIWLVFLPLSYVAPGYTQEWLDAVPPLLTVENGELPFWSNLLWLLAAVAVAPVLEEMLFRGFLLHRLAERVGLVNAVIGSALVFGFVHDEFLGHALFGVVAALLYLRVGSLWAPIALHVTNNTVAVALELIAIGSTSTAGAQTLDEFRSDWPWGLAGLVLGVPWFIWIVRQTWPPSGPLPYDRNAPAGDDPDLPADA